MWHAVWRNDSLQTYAYTILPIRAELLNIERVRYRLPLYLGPVPEDSLPKDAKPGCTLTGSLKIAHTSPLAGDKHAPCGCPLVFTVPPPAKKDPEEKDDVPEEKDPVKKMRNAQRDAQVCTHSCM
jgi:hypothetical protein